MKSALLGAALIAGLALPPLASGQPPAAADSASGRRLAATDPESSPTRSADDTYLDAGARALHAAAQGAWGRIERDVVSYTAVVKERASAELRLPLRDRTLYRSEGASRVFWSRDGGAVIQVLGAREWHPGYDDREDAPTRPMLADDVFDPAGDRLSFGVGDDDEDEIWFNHPLAPDAELHYRFRSGDTLTVSLPGGRTVQAVELEVLPRAADIHRITGSLWIEPGEGALVRAVYRLAETIDVQRDFPDDVDGEDLDKVPGLFKPFTFELSLVAVEYGLWDFEVWLPRNLRAEGRMAAGVLQVPAAFEVSYRIESVVTESDVAEPGASGLPDVVREERHFRTRSEALEHLAGLVADDDMAYELEGSVSYRNGRRVRYLVPEDSGYLARSPHLPPPIWEDAPGFASEAELRDMVAQLAELPAPELVGTPWTFAWGHQRPDLLRYNRVEGPSVGARAQVRAGSPAGPLTLEAESFLGLADLSPKLRVSAAREGLRRRVAVGAYRELATVSHRGRHLGFGNSVTALAFGRDDGEYYLRTGADLTVGPATARRRSWEVRAFAERHEPVRTKIDFDVAHLGDARWRFRPNVDALEHDELGLEARLSPWWGTDPLAAQAGFEVRAVGATGDVDYATASLQLQGSVPLFAGRVRAGAVVEAGDGWGDVPLQRQAHLGSSGSLRGYDAATLVGSAFARTRLEIARVFPTWSLAVFSDAGWAGDALDALDPDDGLASVGLGLSVVDGLIRLDVARGLRGLKRTRWDFYLDGVL